MIKELVKDEEFLQKPAEPATAEDAQVAEDLRDTMASMHKDCACLAANQIGSTKAVIAYDSNGQIAVMFNPQIKQAIVPYRVSEGCLSLDRETEVTRYRRIIVAYQVLVNGELVNKQRRFSDWTAEIIQHAIDHCNGKLV